MPYNKLGLTHGDVLSDIHLSHMEDGIDEVVTEADVFKKKVANILSSKGVATHETDSMDTIAYNINKLGAAITYDDEVDEALIDIRETCPSGCIQMVCSDERTARVRFYIWTKDNGTYTVDWGDGTSNTYNNGAMADHTYRKGSGNPYIGSNTQYVVTISATGGNVINQFKSGDQPEIIWFVSKDVYFENIDCMFSLNAYGSFCSKLLKYVDIIGGSMASKGVPATHVFRECRTLERVTGTIDLSTATSTTYMFYNCIKLAQIPDVLNISNSTDTSYMFCGCNELPRVPSVLDLRKSLYCGYMFDSCFKLRAVPEEINLISALQTQYMFNGCKSLTRIPEIKNAQNVTTTIYMFQNCERLEEVYPILSLPSCANAEYMFKGCVSLLDAPSTINLNSVKNVTEMFRGCSKLQSAPRIINLPDCITADRVFADCINLKVAPVSVSLPVATSCYSFFENCSNLTSAPSDFVAPNSLHIYYMFRGCRLLGECLTDIQADSATNVYGLFDSCVSLMTVRDSYSFPEAINGYNLFYNCQMLTDAPRLSMPKAENLNNIFNNCINLKTTQAYNFPKARTLAGFYRSCKLLEVVEELIVPEATDMGDMYRETASFRIVKSIGGPKVQNFLYLFYSISLANLIEIPSIIDMSSATNMGSWGLYTSGSSVIQTEEVTFIGVRSGLDFYGHPGIKRIRIQNQSELCQNLNFERCGMDKQAIDTLFGDLVRTNVRRTINVKGNPGASTCDVSIATNKGWAVTIA